MSGERWLPIAGAPGYEVSDLGRVRCWRPRNRIAHAPAEPRMLKPLLRGGYYCVRLGGKSSGELRPSIAADFGVSTRTVWIIGTGRGWSHVEEIP
jgi:hypothetical protein